MGYSLSNRRLLDKLFWSLEGGISPLRFLCRDLPYRLKRYPVKTLWGILRYWYFSIANFVEGKKWYVRPYVRLEQSRYSIFPYARGVGGELTVKRIIEERGYHVKRNHPHGPDLVVEGRVSVEVKTAGWQERKRGNGGKYGFNTRFSSWMHRQYSGYVLVCRCLSNPPVHFVIPRYAILEGQKSISICTKDAREHTGKWHEFREAWGWVDYYLDNYR